MYICVEKLKSQPLLQRLNNITVLIIQPRLSLDKSYLHHRVIKAWLPSPKVHVTKKQIFTSNGATALTKSCKNGKNIKELKKITKQELFVFCLQN